MRHIPLQLAAWIACSLIGLVEPSPLTAQASLPRFLDVTDQAGIDFVHSMGASTVENILQSAGGGVCFGDYDGDGLIDLYFANGEDLSPAGRDEASSRLYRNVGEGTFRDVTLAAGVPSEGYAQGCLFGDYDNDGDLDLYVTRYGANLLYRNRGDGTFVDVAEDAGVAGDEWSTGAAYGDCDGDGDLDLYVTNYLEFRRDQKAKRSRLSAKEGYTTFPGPRDYAGEADNLFRNDGDGTFTDVSETAGVNNPAGKGMQAAFSDYDNDGDLDVYVANDRAPNFLYTGRGDCTFEDTALEAGVAFDERGVETGAMGVAFGDIDGDGLFDLLVTNMVFEYNSLYHNLGDGLFEDATRRAGLAEPTYAFVGWGTELFDFDNDGDLDLVVANGHVHDHVEVFSDSVTFEQSNLLFANVGNGKFRDVTRETGSALREANVSRGLAVGDYDNDGDSDLVISNLNSRARLLRNEGGNDNNWIRLEPTDARGHREAIGARIILRSGPSTQTAEVRSGSSYLSQSDRRVLFGLGTGIEVDSVEVRWPSGLVVRFNKLPPHRHYRLVEPRVPSGD